MSGYLLAPLVFLLRSLPWPRILGFLRLCSFYNSLMSVDITLIGSDYYEVIDNSDCNACDDYILVELGPHHSWDEISRIEDWEECPF